MKEEYLHLIWSQKRLPFHLMKLTDGSNFSVKSVGELNKESGPDFFNGVVEINGVKWVGNIEIHVKSSDWYLHKHQFDLSYENVILHVVYEYDKDVYIGDRKIPTIELKKYLQLSHYNSFKLRNKLLQNSIMCKDLFNTIDTIYFESMKEKSLIRRLDRKISFLNDESNFDIGQILYYFLAQAFGMKVNVSPFQQLTYRLPLKIVQREGGENAKVLLFGTSGFEALLFTDDEKNKWKFYKQKYEILPLPNFIWKRKGLRPEGFPEKRLNQFCEIVVKCEFNTHFLELNLEDIYVYLIELMNVETLISKEVRNHIIINGFVPFIYWYGKIKNNYETAQKAINLLMITDAEKNSILKNWKTLGVKIKKAYDSQALLEIFNEFCVKKKCFSCMVGTKLLN
jgi:hypothetical protein